MTQTSGSEDEPPRTPGRAGTPAASRQLRAQGERTLRKLLDAGIEVFGRNGFHATRVQDIVKHAGTSHGTFYLYFSNKEDLFRQLAADIGDELTALADSLGELEPTAEARRRLHAWLGRFITVYRHYGPLLRAWTAAEMGANDAGRLGADILGRFTAALAERVARIEGLPTSPQVTALALVALIERFSFFALVRQVRSSADEVVDALTDAVWSTLFGRDATPGAGSRANRGKHPA
jgi:AcrR family transcriptional regulator